MPNEVLYSSFLASLQDAVFLFDTQARLLFLNPEAEKISATSFAVSKGQSVEKIFPANHSWKPLLEECLATTQSYTLREDHLKNKLGEQFVVEIKMSPILSDEGSLIGVSLVIRDLSHLKKMEEELRYADRQAIMGTIASGLAHEIKNPLGGIKAAAQMLKRSCEKSDDEEMLDIIIKESERVNQLIIQLLNLTKPKMLQKEEVNIHQILDEIIRLEKQNSSLDWNCHFDPSLPSLYADADQLKQALLNIIKNAKEATESREKDFHSHSRKRSIRISTSLLRDYSLRKQDKKARFLSIEIQDEGIGMNQETLSQLFAPFFSTKSSGTGLGLSITHRIITEHGGFIQVESNLGEGSRFKIFLPI